MARYLVPLFVFLGLVVLFVAGLHRDPSLVPSPLINKPLPEFTLPTVQNPHEVVKSDQLQGEVTLLNVWASWCVSCRYEHPVLMDLAHSKEVKIVGFNYKDTRTDALRWLQRRGDPYVMTLFDQSGKVGIDLGVYGVPETYVLDRNGVIRYKQIGPITPEILDETIRPIVKRLQRKESS